jgi:isopenicillin N synthase-like dioxygenase
VLAGEFNAGAKLWPADLPDVRGTMVSYYAAFSVVALQVMRGLALLLKLRADHFAAFTTDTAATLPRPC